MIDIGISGGCRPCSMRLDLDPNLPNALRVISLQGTTVGACWPGYLHEPGPL